MKNIKFYLNKGRVLAVAVVVIGLAGVEHYATSANAIASTIASAAVSVGVQTITMKTIHTWSEFSGRTHAVDYAEIRPEVTGRITEVKFEDGQTVKQGDILFVIDPLPYKAAVAKAEAVLASARTNEQFARTELTRAGNMLKTQAIAQRLYDERANGERVTNAQVGAAEAELETAKINLDRAYVKAPISGRVSRPEITVGNLVQAGGTPPLLTSIVSKDGIYADFDMDEQTYLRSIRANANEQGSERQIPIELSVQGDKEHVYQGKIYSFDNHIDTGSGTIRARARFNNTDGALMPGMFVSVRVSSSKEGEALLVPERALGTDQSKKFVYVVGSDNKVAYHEVQLGAQVGAQRIVLEGLKPGDRVIVDGVQHVRPDAVVDAKEVASAEAQPAPQKIAAQ